MEDTTGEDFKRAKGFFQQRDFLMALEITEDSISVNGKSKKSALLRWLQGTVFSKLAEATEKNNAKSAFLRAAAESFRESTRLFPGSLFFSHCSANSLFSLGQHLSLSRYYEETVHKAKEGLSLENPEEMLECIEDLPSGTKLKKDLEVLIKLSEAKMNPHAPKTVIDFEITVNENESGSRSVGGLQKRSKMRKSETQNAVAERWKSFWVAMGVESKKNFMRVSIEKLKCYVKEVYGREAKEALDRGLVFAKTNKKWKLWKCRACANEFHRSAECKKHLEQEHAMKFRGSVKDLVPQLVDEIWGKMIFSGDWEPVDTAAAVEMIKNHIVGVKQFVDVDGWSPDWPLVDDNNRRTVLKRIFKILKSLLEQKALSCSIRDWIMNHSVKQLGLLGVPQHLLDECGLVSRPQCICFLELEPLKEIQQYLACTEIEEPSNLFSKVVDDYLEHSRIKERISFDHEYSCLLLDRRLLRGKVATFDDEGTIDVGSSDPYARVSPQGDDIISWLLDCPQIDQEYTFRKPIRLHNLDIWLAILRTLQASGRTLGKKYKIKMELLAYNESLTQAEELCADEDERRGNVPKSEWKTYTRALYDICEEHTKDATSPEGTTIFLSAVTDIVEGSTFSGLMESEWEVCLNRISKLSEVSDEFVAQSIKRLKSIVTDKISLIDSKILVSENRSNQLLNDLTWLSMFDYRSFILPLLKWFLRGELEKMEETDAQAKSAEAEASLLAEIEQTEKKKPPLPRKKKKDNKKFRWKEDNKGAQTSKSSPVDQTEEIKPSMVHESGPSKELGDIPELKKTGKEDLVGPEMKITEEVNISDDACPEDGLSSERGRLKHEESAVSFITGNLKETTEVMQTMPGDASDSQPDDVGSSDIPATAPREDAVRYDSVLDMILKSLWHSRFFREEVVRSLGPVHNHVEDRCVICALKDLLSAFQMEQINDEGLYHYLLSDLQIALEHTYPTANGAAFLLMAIFDFLHCWKSPYGGSLVTSIFVIEEFERMDCSRCRREPNYPEQRSYGIVISANSLRKFKIELGGLKFEVILKAIRMNFKMLCDAQTGGCGKRNYVQHVLTRFPAVFTLALEWEENETVEEIHATMVALDTEMDIGMLYKGVNPLTKYHLSSMIVCSEKEYSCIAYENNRWVRHHPSLKEEIGNWKDVLRFCKSRKVWPEILFYEATWWTEKL